MFKNNNYHDLFGVSEMLDLHELIQCIVEPNQYLGSSLDFYI
jgi:hypothetical protein